MNKFKVGDRVKSILKEEYYGIRYGDIGTVQENSQYPFVRWDRTEKLISFNEKDLLKLFTYEDLKKCPVGTKITFENGRTFVRASESDYRTFTDTDGYRGIEDLKGLKDSWLDGYYGEIVKIEEPTYETVYEYKPEILDEAEKRYLKDVIRPFRNRIKYICKSVSAFGKYEYIEVNLGNDTLVLPDFKPNTMYKGMKVDKKYALKELDL